MDFVGDVLQRISKHVAPDTLRQLESEIRRDFGGSRMYIPSGLNCYSSERVVQGRDATILSDKARGLSVPEIAKRHGMTRQGVYKVLRRNRNQ
jgi:Mor family transcriptional regulator